MPGEVRSVLAARLEAERRLRENQRRGWRTRPAPLWLVALGLAIAAALAVATIARASGPNLSCSAGNAAISCSWDRQSGHAYFLYAEAYDASCGGYCAYSWPLTRFGAAYGYLATGSTFVFADLPVEPGWFVSMTDCPTGAPTREELAGDPYAYCPAQTSPFFPASGQIEVTGSAPGCTGSYDTTGGVGVNCWQDVYGDDGNGATLAQALGYESPAAFDFAGVASPLAGQVGHGFGFALPIGGGVLAMCAGWFVLRRFVSG
jgi:hypothetical protein